MVDVRIVLRDNKKMIYKNARASINTQGILRVMKQSESDVLAEFQSDSYYYWEYTDAGTEE